MKMAFKLYYDFSDQQLDIINELSFHATKLYNTVNYNMRNNTYQNYKTNKKVYKTNWHVEYLHSHNYQQCLRVLDQNWKSYFAAIKDYNNGGQHKYTGKPMPPKSKYLNNEVIFTKNAIMGARGNCVLKNNTLSLSLAKKIKDKFKVKSLDFNMKNVKMPKRFDFNKIQQIRFTYDKRLCKWYLLMIYEVDKKRIIFNNDRNRMDTMSIDLGLNNLATCVFNESKKSYISKA